MSERPALHSLASRLGIELEYESALDGERIGVGDETLEALLAARGHEVDSEAAAAAALERVEAAARARLLPPLRVIEAGTDDARRLRLQRAHHDHGQGSSGPLHLRLSLESGEQTRWEAVPAAPTDEPGAAHAARESWLEWPVALPLGHHALEIEGPDGQGCRQSLVVAPRRAPGVDDVLGCAPRAARVFGLMANLYAQRGPHGCGHGDFGDLREIAELAVRHGGCFVAVNPLNAGTHRTGDDSPYSPIDRMHLDPLYLELERMPELEHCPSVRDWLGSAGAAALRAAPRLDRARVWAEMRPRLALLFEAFEAHDLRRGTARGRAYEADRTARGEALRDHATFMALAEWLTVRGEAGVDPWDWRSWPDELRDPGAAAVERFRAHHAREVDFHCWLQWALAAQLAEVARENRAKGLALGLCLDLPLGSRPGGVDTWRQPALYASGIEVGAPPDAYAPDGQAWGFPPMDPSRLVDGAGHLAWVELLRASLACAGALRLDHAMSLNRLFWVPEGASPRSGAYVRYPETELLGLLALESHRAGAVLVGEDLGTVPAGFSERMRERGLLSTRVLYFEREPRGFRAPAEYPAQAMVSANTHDLAPLAAWCTGADVALRRRAGQLSSEAQAEESLRARADDREALEARLRRDGFLGADEPLTPETAPGATARFLAATPCALVGLSLDDLAEETEPINLPGTTPAMYPSWTRRSSRTLVEVERGQAARASFQAMREAGRAVAEAPPGSGDAPAGAPASELDPGQQQ